MNKVVPIAIGAGVIGAVLLMSGSSAKAAPLAIPPAAPVPSTWQNAYATGGLRGLAGWLAIGIAHAGWRFFQPADPATTPQSPGQKDASDALLALQSHAGLTADDILGPTTSGVLMYYVPDIEPVLRDLGALSAHHKDGSAYSASENAAAIANGKAKAKTAEAAEPAVPKA